MSEALQQEIRHLRTLEGSPRDPRDRIFLPLADAHFRLGQFDTAADMLREGLTRLPEFVAAHVLMGRVLEARGDLDEAEETWAAARRLDPQNAEALLALGHILVGRGEEVGGELVLRARALDPTAGGQEPDADLMSIADLAPGAEPVLDSPLSAVPVTELAPYDGEVMSITELAPDPNPASGVAHDASGVDDAPDDVVVEIAEASEPGARRDGDPRDDEPSDDGDGISTSIEATDRPMGEGRVVTRTLAELLAAQGQRPRAIEMYEELVARSPDNSVLGDRLRELRDIGESGEEASTAPASTAPAAPEHDDDEVDHRLSRHDPEPDTPTPFTWTGEGQGRRETSAMRTANDDAEAGSDDADAPAAEEARIADYLGGLLSRSPSSSSGDSSGS